MSNPWLLNVYGTLNFPNHVLVEQETLFFQIQTTERFSALITKMKSVKASGKLKVHGKPFQFTKELIDPYIYYSNKNTIDFTKEYSPIVDLVSVELNDTDITEIPQEFVLAHPTISKMDVLFPIDWIGSKE